MRETRLTRRAKAVIAYYLAGGGRLEWSPTVFSFVTIAASGRRLTWHDEFEPTQPVTERVRELLAA